MDKNTDFDLTDFLPYLLNQAAEKTSLEFQQFYKSRYSMLRTEWRVLFHLGRYGPMTAKQIGTRAAIHKTKVSRAVSALEQKRFLQRQTQAKDRRHETLSLLPRGQAAFDDLYIAAQNFDAELSAQFSATDIATLRRCLGAIAKLP